LLYDTGPRYSLESDAGHRVLLPLLQALQTRLDTVVLSHRDTDHIGGAQAVLAMQPQAALLTSMDPTDERLQNTGAAERYTRCEAGQHWEWDGVQFDILHPHPADYTVSHSPNAVSCVLRIQSAQGRVALLVGDIERPQEEALLRVNTNLHADLLLVPHHGSKTSSSEAFIDAVQPQLAWIQAGYRNRYGHPVEMIVQRYLARGIVVRDSPHCGAMRWSSSGIPEGDCLRTVQRHYWSHRVP
jgi:competence protein ComEC